MSKNSALLKNTAIIAFGKISTQFVTFLLLPLYTTFLTKEEFGAVDLISTYVILLAPILTIQLEMSAFRFLIDARDDKVQSRAIVTNVLQMILMFGLIFTLIYFVFNYFIDLPYSWLTLAAIAAAVISGMLLQFARGFGSNLKFAIGGLTAGVTTIVANILFIVIMGMGANGMLTAIILGNLVASLYLIAALRIHKYLGVGLGDRALMAKLVRYSAPLVPNGISWWLINAVDRTIITIVMGIASNGIYAVAYRFPMVFSGLFSFFGMSWTESASIHINSEDRDKFFSETMSASVRLFGTLGLLIIATVPLIFDLLINDKYREAYMYIPILMVGSFFNTIVGLYSAIYVAKKMTKQVATTSVIAAIISVVFTLTFIHSMGIYAAAFAMPIAFLTMAIYRHYDIKKYVTITYQSQTFLFLGLMYVAVISLYYLNNTYGNIANIVFVLIIFMLFNRTVVSSITNNVIGIHRRRRSVLTPEQELREDLL